jgi:hypothetical protein
MGQLPPIDTPNRGEKRKAAAEGMKAQGERMRRQAGGRDDTINVPPVGTVVLVAADRVDRGKCDHRTVPGVVLHMTEHDNYHIGCIGGVLKDCLSREALRVENGKTPASYGLENLLSVEWTSLKKISVREALANYSPVGGQGMIHCSCKGKCMENRCACKKGNYLCNSRCHKSNTSCENK